MWKLARSLVRQAEEIIASEIESSTPLHGFRVLYLAEDSPAREAGIETWFDFVVGVEDEKLTAATSLAAAGMVESESAPIEQLGYLIQHAASDGYVRLQVWSAKGRVVRDVTVKFAPAHARHAQLADERCRQELGMSVQWTPLAAADHVWHVLDVLPNSSAEDAGLISHADYIIGAERGLLETGGESLLSRVVSSFKEDKSDKESIMLYVYNHDFDTVRPVRVVPREGENGQLMLGCGVGYGLLHRLPLVERRMRVATLLPPGETLYDAEASPGVKSETLEPAPMPAPPTLADNLAVPQPRSRPHHSFASKHHQRGPDLSAYIAEQEARSREIDGPTPTHAVPPPKKASTPAAEPASHSESPVEVPKEIESVETPIDNHTDEQDPPAGETSPPKQNKANDSPPESAAAVSASDASGDEAAKKADEPKLEL